MSLAAMRIVFSSYGPGEEKWFKADDGGITEGRRPIALMTGCTFCILPDDIPDSSSGIFRFRQA